MVVNMFDYIRYNDYTVTVLCKGCDWYNIYKIIIDEDIELYNKNNDLIGTIDKEKLDNCIVINYDGKGNTISMKKELDY